MPIIGGKKAKTQAGISQNIRTMRKEGRPPRQAVAIAMRQAGKPKPKGKPKS